MTFQRVRVKKGQEFYATVRKGPHSRTLGGEETAGRKIGPFTASRDSTSMGAETKDRFFCTNDFIIQVNHKGENYVKEKGS